MEDKHITILIVLLLLTSLVVPFSQSQSSKHWFHQRNFVYQSENVCEDDLGSDPENNDTGPLQTIQGGQETKNHEFPWIARLSIRTRGTYCSGFLYTKLHVITAAHCVSRKLLHLIVVHLGDHNTQYVDEGEQIFGVVAGTIHPQFTIHPGNDIAVLRLSKPAIMTKAVQVAGTMFSVPPDVLANHFAVAAGWGLSPTRLSPTLQKVTMLIIPKRECEARPSVTSLMEDELCTGQVNKRKYACPGDSGAPLHVYVGEPSGYVVVAILSGQFTPEGYKKASCIWKKNYPNIYIHLGYHQAFILESVGKMN